MTYSLHITKAAEEDVREAYLWYEGQKEGLGGIFEMHISEALGSIMVNPLKIQIRYGAVRVFFLTKFPYGVHFYTYDHTILILAVFHTSRATERWEERNQ